MRTILIIEDDITFGLMLKTWLEKKGYKILSAGNLAKAKKMVGSEPDISLILSDLRLPDGEGIVLLEWLKENGYGIPVIIMTGYAEIQSAVLAMKSGARDYISKPVNPEELLKKMEEIFNTPAGEGTAIKATVDAEGESNPVSLNYLEGKSDQAVQLYNYVNLVAPTNMSVLINGASGTGKEYIAHRIHNLSKRATRPFIAIDCGSIPKELAASEFFGHVKGSFTGALSDKTGAFVEANGGSVFLDEIGNLSYDIQVQLLRALQERKVRPIGSNKEIEVDIRLISATNENLEQAIAKGAFREDLFHRINEFTLYIPSLKERKEDILLFANFFLDRANEELGKQVAGFTPEASRNLYEYHWPGNLRQMKNMIRRATLLSQGSYITLSELGSELKPVKEMGGPDFSLYNEDAEKQQIIEALKRTGYNKSKAAKLLNIDRKTLYNKIKLYNLDV